MKSKGATGSHLCRAAAIILTCTSAWLISSAALAQQAVSAGFGTSGQATSWSLRAPATDNTPYLVVAMAEPAANNPSGSDQTAVGNDPGYGTSDSPMPAELSNPGDGATGPGNSQVQAALSGQHVQPAPLRSGSKVFSLLGEGADAGSFRYEPAKNYFRPDQWSANSVPNSHGVEPGPRPLFQVQVGSWRLPVMLSATAEQ